MEQLLCVIKQVIFRVSFMQEVRNCENVAEVFSRPDCINTVFETKVKDIMLKLLAYESASSF
jgi:hypothetical protein